MTVKIEAEGNSYADCLGKLALEPIKPWHIRINFQVIDYGNYLLPVGEIEFYRDRPLKFASVSELKKILEAYIDSRMRKDT